jgi:hypothetical protein
MKNRLLTLLQLQTFNARMGRICNNSPAQKLQTLRLDTVGLTLIACALGFCIFGLFILPFPISLVSLAGFLILNFGGHAAIHRSLLPHHWRYEKILHELILLGSYAFHFSNYHYLVPAHIRHHVYGRADRHGEFDVVDRQPAAIDFVKYYVFLVFVPFSYWSVLNVVKLFRHPLRVRYSLPNSRRVRFRLPYCIPALCSLSAFAVAAYHSAVTLFLYFAISAIIWNVLQNVAHYGLGPLDEHLGTLASRTYLVELPFRVLTFGSLAHLPHHFDMNIPGALLHEPSTIKRVEAGLGAKIEIVYGIRGYLKDVVRQFRGPVSRENLSTGWLSIPRTVA